jgi:hypothetical protein
MWCAKSTPIRVFVRIVFCIVFFNMFFVRIFTGLIFFSRFQPSILDLLKVEIHIFFNFLFINLS